MMNPLGLGNNRDSHLGGDSDRMSRLVLARMKTLEEGFADVVREIRAMQRTSGHPSTAHSSGEDGGFQGWDTAYRTGAGTAMIEVAGNRYRLERAAGRRTKTTAAAKTYEKTPPSGRIEGERFCLHWLGWSAKEQTEGGGYGGPV